MEKAKQGSCAHRSSTNNLACMRIAPKNVEEKHASAAFGTIWQVHTTKADDAQSALLQTLHAGHCERTSAAASEHVLYSWSMA